MEYTYDAEGQRVWTIVRRIAVGHCRQIIDSSWKRIVDSPLYLFGESPLRFHDFLCREKPVRIHNLLSCRMDTKTISQKNANFKSGPNWATANLKSGKRESMIRVRISARHISLSQLRLWSKSSRLCNSLTLDNVPLTSSIPEKQLCLPPKQMCAAPAPGAALHWGRSFIEQSLTTYMVQFYIWQHFFVVVPILLFTIRLEEHMIAIICSPSVWKLHNQKFSNSPSVWNCTIKIPNNTASREALSLGMHFSIEEKVIWVLVFQRCNWRLHVQLWLSHA